MPLCSVLIHLLHALSLKAACFHSNVYRRVDRRQWQWTGGVVAAHIIMGKRRPSMQRSAAVIAAGGRGEELIIPSVTALWRPRVTRRCSGRRCNSNSNVIINNKIISYIPITTLHNRHRAPPWVGPVVETAVLPHTRHLFHFHRLLAVKEVSVILSLYFSADHIIIIIIYTD